MLVWAHHDHYSEIEHVRRGHFVGDQWLDDGPKVDIKIIFSERARMVFHFIKYRPLITFDKSVNMFKMFKTGSQFCS